MEISKIILTSLLIILLILYLVVIPIAKKKQMKQKQRHFDQMLAKLKIGDKILLSDGIVGYLTNISKDEAKLKVSENAIITIKKMAIMAKL